MREGLVSARATAASDFLPHTDTDTDTDTDTHHAHTHTQMDVARQRKKKSVLHTHTPISCRYYKYTLLYTLLHYYTPGCGQTEHPPTLLTPFVGEHRFR